MLSKLQETFSLELKEGLDDLPQTYSSFANTHGGTIILGVKELVKGEFSIVGVPDAEGYLRDIWNTLKNRNKVNKNILSNNNVRIEHVGTKDIIVLDIPRANREDKPLYINNDIFNGTYRRDGEGDYRCSEAEVRLMIRDASTQTLDLAVLSTMSLDALCPDTIGKYRRRLEGVKPELSWHTLSDEQLLYRLNAIGKSDNDEEFHPTVAGLLMFGYHYEIVKECPYYLLDYREETDPKTRWVDRVVSDAGVWSGNIFDFYSAVVPKLEFGLKVPFKLKGMVRIDDTPVHQAIRESLVNALVHTNYYERQGVVIIKGTDSYRFSNPGSLRIPIEDAVTGGFSDPRNQTLFTMFTLLNIGERAGTGLSNIFSVWQEQHWASPTIVESLNPERTTLTLLLRSPKEGDTK